MNIRCTIFGHTYEVLREFSPTVRQVRCPHCGKLWGMNDSVEAFVEWDDDLERATIEAYGRGILMRDL